jgi:hypothetical protein
MLLRVYVFISSQQIAPYLDPHPDTLDFSSQQRKVWAIRNYHGSRVIKITNLFNKISVKLPLDFTMLLTA